MCSAMSAMGIGGWLSMPGGRADPVVRAGHSGASPGAGGRGGALQCESVTDALWLERVAGDGEGSGRPTLGPGAQACGSVCKWSVRGAAPS